MHKKGRTDEEPQKADGEWRGVLRIASREEFRQSLAVAELAVRLSQLKLANQKSAPIEKENLDPQKFLEEAWALIQSAREYVLRPETNAEYLAAHGGSDEAAEKVVGRILSASHVPFEKLCHPQRNKGDTEMIKLPDHATSKPIAEEWKVYRGEGGERAFDKLFWAYWRETSMRSRMMVSRSEVPGNGIGKWKEYGEALLASWKRDGVPPNDFLALVRFRREQKTKRVANLKKKPKRKLKRPATNARAGQRKRRAH
jgi:hypothetical protein